MKTIWRCALQATLLWSAVAHGQGPSTPPDPPAVPREAAPTLPPDQTSGEPPVAPAATEGGALPLDQGPDALPSLDEEAPLTAPPASPAVSVVSVGPPRPLAPIRAERRLALLGEIGWNSLAGFGADLSYHAHPKLSFDLGVGIGLVGGKVGLRTRYNFLLGPVTPFVGVGVIGSGGFDAPTRDISDDDSSDLNVKVDPSAFLQGVVGVDWTSRGGFTLVGCLGYAWLLTGDNVVVVTGVPTEEERNALSVIFGSSIVLSFAIGYSFR
jgi:hypothetical protein